MFDWTAFETTFVEAAGTAVRNWLIKNSKQHVYAIAFHECYSELDGVITIPSLGINSLEKLTNETDTKDEGWKWSPGDWRWTSILPTRSPLASLVKELTDEACCGSQAHWRKTKKHFDRVLLNVTRQLYREFAKHPQATDDFVVYIEDEDGGLELIKRCVPARLYKKHFERVEKPSYADLSPRARLAKYMEEIFPNRDKIVAMGPEAIGPLIKKLDDPEDGWVAARILADFNRPTKPVMSALRSHVQAHGSTGMHSAIALHLLGDVEFLYGLLTNKKLREQAIGGILAGLQYHASGRNPHLPLDYRHVERLLAMKSKAIEQQVIEELQPGSSFVSIKASDIDEVLRGLNSCHVVIRQHASCVSWDRSLGKNIGKKLLPVLAAKLADPVPNVRRLALLGLANWKAAAIPYHAEMKKLRRDKDPLVREFACGVFSR